MFVGCSLSSLQHTKNYENSSTDFGANRAIDKGNATFTDFEILNIEAKRIIKNDKFQSPYIRIFSKRSKKADGYKYQRDRRKKTRKERDGKQGGENKKPRKPYNFDLYFHSICVLGLVKFESSHLFCLLCLSDYELG